MKTPELKPCPFCGGEAEIDSDEYGDGPNRMSCTRVYCSNCYCETDWNTGIYDFKDAIDIWNTRVYPPEVQAAIERDKPKEPIVKVSKYGKNYFCPTCDNDVSETYDCCSACGQRLDWREREE